MCERKHFRELILNQNFEWFIKVLERFFTSKNALFNLCTFGANKGSDTHSLKILALVKNTHMFTKRNAWNSTIKSPSKVRFPTHSMCLISVSKIGRIAVRYLERVLETEDLLWMWITLMVLIPIAICWE